MADLGYLDALAQGIPDLTTRQIFKLAMRYVVTNLHLGHPDQHARAANMQWYFQRSTSASDSTTEFSFEHGLQTAPYLAIPVLDLQTAGSVAGGFQVSRVADTKRVYLKPTAGSTNAACLFLVE